MADWDYSRDFVKVPRKIVQVLARDAIALQVYMQLLARARWVEGAEVGLRGLTNLQAGEAVVGRAELAASCFASEGTVRGALIRLQNSRIIAIRSTSRGTIVSLLGYGGIDATSTAGSPAGSPAVNQQLTSNSPAIHQPVSHYLDPRSEKERSKKSLSRDERLPIQSSWKPNEEAIARAQALGVDVDGVAQSFRRWADREGIRDVADGWHRRFADYLERAPTFIRGHDAEQPVRRIKPLRDYADEVGPSKPWVPSVPSSPNQFPLSTAPASGAPASAEEIVALADALEDLRRRDP